MKTILTLNREQIKEHLPHREPMLLVDEMVLFEDENGKQYCTGKLHITGDEYFVNGHFPGYPVVPGVILCEIMGQSSSILMLEALKGRTPFFTGIDGVRFKKQVRPNDTVEVTAKITSQRGPLFFVDATAKVDGEVCASGKLSFALIDSSTL